MAKTIRSIKAELCDDEILATCSRDARLLFVGLITRCDDFGRFRARPEFVRSRVFPYDADVTVEMVEAWLAELEGKGRLHRFQADGQTYGELVNWTKHQRIDNAAKSDIPPCGEPLRSAANSGDSRRPAAGEEGKGTEGSGTTAVVPTATGEVRSVFDAWRESTGRNGRTQLSRKRKRRITDALAAYPLEDVIAAVRGWRHSPHHRGENDRRTVYNELELLLRDPEHIEKFRDLERGAASHQPAPAAPKGAGAVVRAMERRGIGK